MAEGKRATEVMMKQERRGGNTTMTYRTKRYTFPSAPTQGDVKSDAMCVMLDMGLHCPFCTSAFSAKFSSTHKRLMGKRPHDHQGHMRPAIGGPEAQHKALVRKGHTTHAQPHLGGNLYHEVEASVAVNKVARQGEQLTIRDMKVYMRDPKKKVPPPVPPRKGQSARIINREEVSPVGSKPPPPPPKSPAISMTHSEPGGHQVRQGKKIPPPVPPRKRPPPRDDDAFMHTDDAIFNVQHDGDMRVKMRKPCALHGDQPEVMRDWGNKRATTIPVCETDGASPTPDHIDQAQSPTQTAFAHYCITGKPNATRPPILTKKRPLTKYDLNLSPRTTHRNNDMPDEYSVTSPPTPPFPVRTKSVSPKRVMDTNNQSPHMTFTPPTRKRPLTKYDFNLQDIPPYRKRTYSRSSDRSDKSSNASQKPPPPPVPKRLYPPGPDGKPLRKSVQGLKASSFPYRLRDVHKHRAPIPVYSEIVYTSKSPGEKLTSHRDSESPPPRDEELERLITEGLSNQHLAEPVSSSASNVPASTIGSFPTLQERSNVAPRPNFKAHGEISYAVVGVPGRLGEREEFETHSLPRLPSHQSTPYSQAVAVMSGGDNGRISSIKVSEKKTQKRVFQDMAKHESMETLCHQRDQTINVTSVGNVQKETVVSSTEQISISRRGFPEPAKEEEKPDVGIDELVDELHNLEDRLTDISNEPKQSKPVNIIRRTIIKHNVTPEPRQGPEQNHTAPEQSTHAAHEQRTPVIQVGDYMVGGARTKVHRVVLEQQPVTDEHQDFENDIMSNIEQYDNVETEQYDNIDGFSTDDQGSRDTLDLLVSEAQECYPNVSRDRTPVPVGEQVGGEEVDEEKDRDSSGSSDEELSLPPPDFEGNVDDVLENADTTRYSPNATLKNVFTQPRKKKRHKKMIVLLESEKEHSPEKVFEDIMDAEEKGNKGVTDTLSDPDLLQDDEQQRQPGHVTEIGGFTQPEDSTQKVYSSSVECIPDDRSSLEFGRTTPSGETKSQRSLDVLTTASSDIMPSSNYGGVSDSSLDRMIGETSALTDQILTSYSADIKQNEERQRTINLMQQTSSDNELIELDDSEQSSSHDMLEHSDASDYDSAELILAHTDEELPETDRIRYGSRKPISILRESPEIRSAPQTLDRRLRVYGEFNADSASDSLEDSFVFRSKQEARCRGSWPNPDVLQRMLSPLERGQVYDVRRTVTPDNLSYKESFFSSSSEVEISTLTNPHTPEPQSLDHKQVLNRELSLEFGEIKEDFDNRPRVASVNKGDIRTCGDIKESPPREDHTVESSIHELRRSPIRTHGNDMDRSTEISQGEVLTLSREYKLCTDQLSDIQEIAGLQKTRDEIVDPDVPTDQCNTDFEYKHSMPESAFEPSDDFATVKRGPGSWPNSEASSLSQVYHQEVSLDQCVPTPSDTTDSELAEICKGLDAEEETTPQYVNIEAAIKNGFQPQHAQVVQLRDHVHEGSPVLTASVSQEDEHPVDEPLHSLLPGKQQGSVEEDDDEPYVKKPVSILIDQFNKDFERKPSIVTAKVPLNIRTSYSPKMQRKEILKPVDINIEEDTEADFAQTVLAKGSPEKLRPKGVTKTEVILTQKQKPHASRAPDVKKNKTKPPSLSRTESSESREQMDSVYERKSSHTGAPIGEKIKASYSPRVPKKEILQVVKVPSNDYDEISSSSDTGHVEMHAYKDSDVSDNISTGDLDDEIEDIINELRRDAEEQELIYAQTSDKPTKKSSPSAAFKIDKNRNYSPKVRTEVRLETKPQDLDKMTSPDKKVSESRYDVIVSGAEPTPNLCVRTTQATIVPEPSLQDSCKYLPEERPESGAHETSQLAEDSYDQARVIFAPAAPSSAVGRPQQPSVELGQPGKRQPAPQQPASPSSQEYQTDTLLTSPDTTDQELSTATDDMSSVAQTSICTETQMDFAKAKTTGESKEEAPKERRPSVAEGSICMETQFEVAKQHKTKIESENEKNREKSGVPERRTSVATESVCQETQFDLADSKKAAKDAVNAERRASVATETVCAETQFDLANKVEEKGQTETGDHSTARRSSAATASICMETQLDFAKLDLSKDNKVSGSDDSLYDNLSYPDEQQIQGEHVELPVAMLGSCDSVGDNDYKEQVDVQVQRRPSAAAVSVCTEAVLNMPQVDDVDLRQVDSSASEPTSDSSKYASVNVCNKEKLDKVNVMPIVVCKVKENSIDKFDEIRSEDNDDDYNQVNSETMASVKVCPDSNLNKAALETPTNYEVALHPPLRERRQDTPDSETESICTQRETSFSPVSAHLTEEGETPKSDTRDIKVSGRPKLEKMNSTIDIDNSVFPFEQITPSTSDESEKEGTPAKEGDVKSLTSSVDQSQPPVVVREHDDDPEVDISGMCVFDLLSQVHSHYDRRTSAASATPCLDGAQPASDTENDKADGPEEKSQRRSSVTTPIFPVESPFDQESVSEAPTNRRPSVATETVCIETQFDVANCDDDSSAEVAITEDVPPDIDTGTIVRRSSVANEKTCPESELNIVTVNTTPATERWPSFISIGADDNANKAQTREIPYSDADDLPEMEGIKRAQVDAYADAELSDRRVSVIHTMRRTSIAEVEICTETQYDIASCNTYDDAPLSERRPSVLPKPEDLNNEKPQVTRRRTSVAEETEQPGVVYDIIKPPINAEQAQQPKRRTSLVAMETVCLESLSETTAEVHSGDVDKIVGSNVQYVPVRKSSIATTSVVLETIIDRSEQSQSKCVVLYQDAELSERRPSVLPTAEDLEKSILSHPAEVAVEREMPQISQEDVYDDADLSGRRPSVLPTYERRSSIATGEICMETTLQFASSTQAGDEGEDSQEASPRGRRPSIATEEVCMETQLDIAATDREPYLDGAVSDTKSSIEPVTGGRRPSLASETTCTSMSYERVTVSESKPVQSAAVAPTESQRGVLDIDLSVVPYDDMMEPFRDQWDRVSVRKPSATNSSIPVEKLKQYARVESSKVRVCHEDIGESVHKMPSQDNLDITCGHAEVSFVDQDTAAHNVNSNQAVQNVRPVQLGSTTCSLHDLTDRGKIMTNIAHESSVSDQTCESAVRRPSLASESVLEPIHTGIKVTDFKPKKSIKTDKANIYAYAYTCAQDIFSAAMHDICRRYVQSKRKNSLQHKGSTEQPTDDNTLHLFTESHANVATFETDDTLTKQEAEGFLRHMLVSHRSETTIAAGKPLVASDELAECLAELCHVPDDPEEEVLSEELTTHEVIIEFSWPRTAWTPPLKLYKEPYREINLKRVTRISDFDVDRKEIESSDTRPHKAAKELTDSDSTQHDRAERTVRKETIEETEVRQAKPTHVAGHVSSGDVDDSTGVSDRGSAGETALSSDISTKTSPTASGGMTVGGGLLGDRGFRYMAYSGSGPSGDGICLRSDAQPTHVPRLLYPETQASHTRTTDTSAQHVVKSYRITHGGSTGSLQEHASGLGHTGAVDQHGNVTYEFDLEQKGGVYYVTQKSGSAPNINEPAGKYLKVPKYRRRGKKGVPRVKTGKISSQSFPNRSSSLEEPKSKRSRIDEPVTVFDLADQLTTSGSALSSDDDKRGSKFDYEKLEESLRKNCPFYPAELSDTCGDSASTAVTPIPESNLPDLCIDAERQSMSVSDNGRSSSSTLDRNSKTVQEIFGQLSQNEFSDSEPGSTDEEDLSFGQQMLETDVNKNPTDWVINPISREVAVTGSYQQGQGVPFDYATHTKSTTESAVSDSRSAVSDGRSSYDASHSESGSTSLGREPRKASMTRQHAIDLAYSDTPSREDSDTASESLKGLKVMYPSYTNALSEFRPCDDSESTLSAESDSEDHVREQEYYNKRYVTSRSMPSVFTAPFGRCEGMYDPPLTPEPDHELDYFLFAQEGVRVIRPEHPDDLHYLESDRSDHSIHATASYTQDPLGSEMFDKLQVMAERFQETPEEVTHEHRRMDFVTQKQRSEEQPAVVGEAVDEGRARSLSWGDARGQTQDKTSKSQVRQRIRSRREFAIRARLHNPRSTSTSSSDRSPLPFRKWTPKSSGSSQERMGRSGSQQGRDLADSQRRHYQPPWQDDLLERSVSSPVLSPTSKRKQADTSSVSTQSDMMYSSLVQSSPAIRPSQRSPREHMPQPVPYDTPFSQYETHSRQVEVSDSLIGSLPGQPIVATRTPPKCRRRVESHALASEVITEGVGREVKHIPKPGTREKIVKKMGRKSRYK